MINQVFILKDTLDQWKTRQAMEKVATINILQNHGIEGKRFDWNVSSRKKSNPNRFRRFEWIIIIFIIITIIDGGTMHIRVWRARRPSSYRGRRTNLSQIKHSNVALEVRSIRDDSRSRPPSIKLFDRVFNCIAILEIVFSSFLFFLCPTIYIYIFLKHFPCPSFPLICD